MRFFNLFRYDLRRGRLFSPGRLFAVVSLFSFLFLCFCVDVFQGFYFELKSFWEINSLSLSFGDVLLGKTGGILPQNAQSQSFLFPTEWLAIQMLLCYFTLGYFREDFTRGGVQVIPRMGSKTVWWLSKCLWNICSVTLYYCLGYGTLLFLIVLTGKSPSFTLNSSVFEFYFSCPLPAANASQGELFLALCVLPWLTAVAVNLVQMALTIVLKPALAYLATGCWLVVGVYYAHAFVLPNYSLSVRSGAVGVYGFQSTLGIALCLGTGLLAVAAGLFGLRRKVMIDSH